jgi:hypothetical protein
MDISGETEMVKTGGGWEFIYILFLSAVKERTLTSKNQGRMEFIEESHHNGPRHALNFIKGF